MANRNNSQVPAIRGETQLYGLIGWPVGHTLSPPMHNAAAADLGLDLVYVPLPVRPVDLGVAIRGLPALGFRGASVTVPHKQAVLSFLDELEPAAKAIGAVNTIVISRQRPSDAHRLVGHRHQQQWPIGRTTGILHRFSRWHGRSRSLF